MSRFVLHTLFLASIVLIACEKVIDIPLEESDRKFVIEGVLKDTPGDNYITISKTGNVYSDSNFEKITGATVSIVDNLGNNFIFSETEPGNYQNALFTVEPDKTYNLSVTKDNNIFTSTGNSFYKPTLDSLNYIEQIGSFGFGTDTTYLVFFSFVDNGSQTNYYRINAFVNGVREDAYYIVDDKLNNGQNYTQPLFGSTIEKGDTVLVELLAMDKGNYDYFFSLPSATNGGDPFSPTPSNPVSNIEGGALGYFGVYTTDTLTIIIPE